MEKRGPKKKAKVYDRMVSVITTTAQFEQIEEYCDENDVDSYSQFFRDAADLKLKHTKLKKTY